MTLKIGWFTKIKFWLPLTRWSRAQNYALSRAELYKSSAGSSRFLPERTFLFRGNLYQMNHKTLIFLVLLVISDFSNHRTIKNEQEMRRDFCPDFRGWKGAVIWSAIRLLFCARLKLYIKNNNYIKRKHRNYYFWWKN